MRKTCYTLLWMVAAINFTCAQDTLRTQTLQETVVIGTRFDVPVEQSGKVIFKVKADQLRTRFSVADALNEVPGIQMDGNFGTPGTNLSYYVRGGRSKQTLIMLDGVPVSDPSGINPFYDLRFVSTRQVGQIEILQGGLSTLYGSGASASVINIQTKTTQRDGIHGGVGVQAGSWNTFGQNINLTGKEKRFSFLVSGANMSSTGFSAAQQPDDTTGYDDDGFKSRNGFLKLGYQITSSLKAEVFGGIDWFDAEYDLGSFSDGDESGKQKQNRVGAKIIQAYSKGSVALTAQYTDINRKIKGSYPTEYDGNNWYGEIVHQHAFNDVITLLSGVSIQNLSYDEKNIASRDTTTFIIIDPYTSVLISMKSGFSLHAGVRLNTHSDYGTKFLYNVNPSWLIDVTDNFSIKPFASVSTAFISPTLYQLHASWGGNKNLKPEESLNYEYGLSAYMGEQLTVTAVNFIREEENVIDYVTRYENLSSARQVKGVTVNVRYKPLQILTISADFTWVTADEPAGFYRIPGRKVGAGLQLTPIKNMNASIRYQHTGSRTDLFYDEMFNPVDVELESYSLVDLSVSQSFLKERLSVYGSVYNLLDESFMGVYGYTTRGRNFSIGINYSF